MIQTVKGQHDSIGALPGEQAESESCELVDSVLTWMVRNECWSYARAFQELGVSPARYYEAMRQPAVRRGMRERARATDGAALRLIEERWSQIVETQMHVAQGEG